MAPSRELSGRDLARPRPRANAADRGRARQRRWLVLALAAFAGVLALAWFPWRAYHEQNSHRTELVTQVAEIEAANANLTARIRQLGTPQEIERLARERYQLVRPDEEAYVIVPDGWEAPPPPAAPVDPEPAERGWWDRAVDGLLGLL